MGEENDMCQLATEFSSWFERTLYLGALINLCMTFGIGFACKL